MSGLRLKVVRESGSRDELLFEGFTCFATGYTGRDRELVDRHISELKENGVPPPLRVPSCYPVLPHLLTVGPGAIHVYGASTSGEVEPVLIVLDRRPRYVGVGSDHTDRSLERNSVPLSKQLCAKVLSSEVWDFEEIAGRWDDLELESRSDGERYQSATTAAMLPVEQLLEAVPAGRRTDRMVVFCGTIPLLAGLQFGSRFSGSLRDPDTGRSLEVDYEVRALSPID